MFNMHARKGCLCVCVCLSESVCVKGVNCVSVCACVRVDRRLTASHLSMESDDLDSTRTEPTLWIA